MNKRIILIIGSTETLGYFSKQMGIAFAKKNIEVFYWDMRQPLASRQSFEALPDKENSILVTFNFLGLSHEGQCEVNGTNIWDLYGIKKYVIMVDSPMYYFNQLSEALPDTRLICIDRGHAAYVEKWYPQFEKPLFMPLCGNFMLYDYWTGPGVATNPYANNEHPIIKDYSNKNIIERPNEIVFIGNYVPNDSLKPAMAKAGPDYQDFMFGIIDNLIRNPELVMEDEIERNLKEVFDDEDESMFPEAMYHMVFIDLYVRTYFRGKLIKTLADSGFKIHLVGQDWDKLECNHSENLIYTRQMMTSKDCLEALEISKISLNIMPWFKSGAHDRIFSSMLSGCVTVTDTSDYLKEILTPDKDHVSFSLTNMEELPDRLHALLKDNDKLQYIADNGLELVKPDHTWETYAYTLLDNMSGSCYTN